MKFVRSVFFIAVCCFSLCSGVFAQLKINFIAVNPSQTESREIDVEYFLPAELEPNDVLDTGPLKLEFNVEKNSMYVHGKMKFDPKEAKTFAIRVNDVWKIDAEEIALLKDQMGKSIELLKTQEPAKYDDAIFVRDQMFQQMDFILRKQADFSGNIERRIEEYRANISTLESIRDNVYSMDFLKFESPSIRAVSELKNTVKMVIQVKNPSDTKARTLEHKHYLPKEVRGEDVLDSQGFEIRFSESKDKLYLTKEDKFGAGETKKYTIILKDVWHFPEVKLQDLDDRAQIAMLELEGTAYQESANRLYKAIQDRMQKIKESKILDTSVDRHIGLYRLNTRRFDKCWDDFKRIEEMISIVRATKLADMERKKVKNVLERLKALRGLKQLSEALFKKRLSVNVTWKIIFGTLAFIAFFTALHFFIWAKRSKVMGEELAPKGGEGIKLVPKPGEEKKDDDE